MNLVEPREDLFARHAWHPHIEQDQIGRVCQCVCQPLHWVLKNGHDGRRLPQHPLDVFTQCGLIVDYENAAQVGVPPANQW